MEISEQLTSLIVLPVFFGLSAWIIKLFLDARKARLKHELNQKLMDKFDSVEKLNDFLQSDSGSRFLRSLTIEGLTPKERLLSALSKGVISGFLGLSILALALLFAEDWRYIVGTGIVVVALGLGFLVSAAISFKLSREWGLIRDDE